MDEATEVTDPLKEIWEGDLLGRREEADTIQAYIEHESSLFLKQEREQSLVLAIDAEYGQGKSWFLDRLAAQLSLEHPVARIDAWADDASEEPLTAFMASIDEALSPFLTKSKKLSDKMAAAKVAALPVMGRLIKGVMVKGLTKVAGDGAEDALGDTFEDAVSGARNEAEKEDGAISKAVEGAFEEVGKEIDNLVDRRGAAMLAEYRQRKKSRVGFRRNMRELVSAIDTATVGGSTPLIVIIDELDRCRPDYSVRVLEEIKHFFEVPGVVFILALHGAQLQASIEAVYGSSFKADEYLRRFFTRKWSLRPLTTHEIVASECATWGKVAERFTGATVILHPKFNSKEVYLSEALLISTYFDAFGITAREAKAILDSLRLMALEWSYEVKISLLLAVPMAINFVRSINLQNEDRLSLVSFGLPAMRRVGNGYDTVGVSVALALRQLWKYKNHALEVLARRPLGQEACENFAFRFFEEEYNIRKASGELGLESNWSLISSYEERLTHIGGFLEHFTDSK